MQANEMHHCVTFVLSVISITMSYDFKNYVVGVT